MKTTEDLIIDDLIRQVAKLSHETAVLRAVATQKEVENQQLKQEIEQIKNEQSPAE